MTDLLFAALSAALVAASVAVVLSRNLYRATYALAAALASTAGLFFLLSSPLLAAVQLLLYTGGVLTLVVYALVLTESAEDPRPWRRPLPAAAASVLLFASLAPLARHVVAPPSRPAIPGAREAGVFLFRDYAVAFELLSVLLLAALFGALAIARKETSS